MVSSVPSMNPKVKLPPASSPRMLPEIDADQVPYWASGSVAVVRSAGWLAGYPDGSFGGGRTITRAEAVVVTNRPTARRDQTEVPVWEGNSWQVETVAGLSPVWTSRSPGTYQLQLTATLPDGRKVESATAIGTAK